MLDANGGIEIDRRVFAELTVEARVVSGDFKFRFFRIHPASQDRAHKIPDLLFGE